MHTAIHYPIPIHLQPASKYLNYKKGSFPKTESQSKKILTIPIHQNLTKSELKRIVSLLNNFAKKINEYRKKIKLDKRSKYLRGLVVRSLLGGGRGHMGSAMSLIEILRVLYDNVANISKNNFKKKTRDRVILSKGHGCLALYAILADKNFIHKKELDKASRINSILGGHPESSKVNGVEASTGSLGHGMPIGVGLALASKISKLNYNTFVIVGDGEINEGSVWESAMIGRNIN